MLPAPKASYAVYLGESAVTSLTFIICRVTKGQVYIQFVNKEQDQKKAREDAVTPPLSLEGSQGTLMINQQRENNVHLSE